MSQPGLVAGTQCQAGREARLRNNIMRSKPSCSRYGAARLRRERAIWIFWKVIEVIIIRGDRRERQQREEKRHVERVYFQWNLQGGQETKKRFFFFSFLKGSFLQSTMITRVSGTVKGQEDCGANFESQELRNVTVCLRNIWIVWVSYWNLGILKFGPMDFKGMWNGRQIFGCILHITIWSEGMPLSKDSTRSVQHSKDSEPCPRGQSMLRKGPLGKNVLTDLNLLLFWAIVF